MTQKSIEIDSDTDVQTLQEDLRIMSEWSNKCLFGCDERKCFAVIGVKKTTASISLIGCVFKLILMKSEHIWI